MTRTFIACTSPVALTLGMLLAHCSSSSTEVTEPVDSGTGADVHATGSSSGSSLGSAPGSASGSGTSVGSSPGSGSASGSGSAAGSSTGSGSSVLTDTHDAGPCVGPSGGSACDPGNVECGGNQCAVPGNECCNEPNNAFACLAVTASCSGNKQECDEKSDCPDGQLCCLKVTGFSGAFTISCQTGTTCPTGGLASTQICKTNAECPGGECSLYNCQNQITEACSAPSSIDCTKM